MREKEIALTLFAAILLSVTIVTQLANVAKANPIEPPPPPPPIEHVYIRDDGSIDPSSTPILRTGNLYTLTENMLNSTIEVQRDNIIIDGAGFTLEGHSPYEGLTITESSNVTVMNLEIKQSRTGIVVSNSSHCVIIDSRFVASDIGLVVTNAQNNSILRNHFETSNAIELFHSSFNNFSDNTVASGGWGIIIIQRSSENAISRNNITGSGAAIYMSTSRGNSISQNVIENNKIGICINNAAFDVFVTIGFTVNAFSQNSFINNEANVYTREFPYEQQPPSDFSLLGTEEFPYEGQLPVDFRSFVMNMSFAYNFWSDYNGTDGNGDGVGDTPHRVSDNYTDNYPLMAPYETHLVGEIVQEPFPTTLVIAASGASLTVVGLCLLIFFKKRKRGQPRNACHAEWKRVRRYDYLSNAVSQEILTKT
jgi:parallel beta-helix repeat protein